MTHIQDSHPKKTAKEDVPVWGQEDLVVKGFIFLMILALILWGLCLYFFPKTTLTISVVGILHFMIRADKETLQQAGVQLEQR
jgi:cell division septal protein FtsQ